MLYANWDYGEPDYGEDENCVVVTEPMFSNARLNRITPFRREPKDAYWNDVACKSMHHPVCQVAASKPGNTFGSHINNYSDTFIKEIILSLANVKSDSFSADPCEEMN